MAVKKGNKYIQITLTPYHDKKLHTMCKLTGLSKSAVIQRLIERYDLIGEKKADREEQK